MVLRGIQRSKSHGRTRRAISTATLGKIVNHLITEYPSTTHDRYMLAAATCLAFYALLRVSEFASPTRSSFLSHRTLARQDIKIKKHTISLRIRASKTDQQRRGHTLLVGCTHTSPCPVELLTRYLQLRKHSSSQSPLFLFKDGSYLTQRTFSAALKQSLLAVGRNHHHYSPHSLRIGGATAAAKAGVEPTIIQELGRWRSQCYRRYTRAPNARLSNAARSMASGQRTARSI